jgi:glutaredoxin
MRRTRLALSVGLALIAGAAAAQQLYRWTDEKGRVHVTDTPPPPTARDVQKKKGGSGTDSAQGSGTMPYELAQAVKDFPVMLYTSPSCGQACASARGALNKRSVPFKEMQVWDEKSNEELKRVSGGTDVPTLLVGRSVQKGFEQGAYDALLDSARYPKSGLLPPRTQAPPPPPEGYVPPSGEAPKAEPAKPEAEAPKAATGPYAPGAPPQRPQKK